MTNKEAQQALRIQIIHLERELELKTKLLSSLKETWKKVWAIDFEIKPFRQVADQVIANGLGSKVVDPYDVPVTLKAGRILQ